MSVWFLAPPHSSFTVDQLVSSNMKALLTASYFFLLIVLYFVTLTESAVSPTRQPTRFPTVRPTSNPSLFPTSKPSGQPTGQPTSQPSPWSNWFTTNLVSRSSISFGNASPPGVNTTLIIDIEIVMSVATNSTFEFVVTLPRMYKPYIDDYYDGYVESAELAVTPSNRYQVVWVSDECPPGYSALCRPDFIIIRLLCCVV